MSGAHHPEPPSPMQSLWDNLCVYLSIFRNCGAFRLAPTICYTVQYNTIRHSTTQLNTKQYNTVHYTTCFLWNLSWPGVKTVLKIERYAQRLTQGYMGVGGSGDGLLVMFFLLYKHADDGVFDDFPKISDHFPKISEHSPRISENIWRYPKISEDCRRLSRKTRRCFDDTPTNLKCT